MAAAHPARVAQRHHSPCPSAGPAPCVLPERAVLEGEERKVKVMQRQGSAALIRLPVTSEMQKHLLEG